MVLTGRPLTPEHDKSIAQNPATPNLQTPKHQLLLLLFRLGLGAKVTDSGTFVALSMMAFATNAQNALPLLKGVRSCKHCVN